MATNFPSSFDSYTHPNPNDPRSGGTSLSTFFSNIQDAVSAVETKVGINSSADTTSFDYKLSGVATSDKAVSLTGSQTLTNKTLTAPKINIGVDATGDMYYRDSGGNFQRLAAPADGSILSWSGGLPVGIPNPAASNASTTVKGVGQIATTADITAGTSTGSTGAILLVPASAVGAAGANKLVQYNSSGQLPAVDGSLLTGLAGGYVSAITTNSSSTNQNIDTVFTCGFAASLITIYFKIDGQGNSSSSTFSHGVSFFNGTTFVNTLWDFENNASASAALTGATRIFNTDTPAVGAATGSPSILVTISITSVTSTGFTVRVAYTGAAGSPTGHASFFAVANK